MKSLLLIAHGSKKADAKDEILSLTGKLRERLQGNYDMVSCAFLERVTPTVPEKIQEFIDNGAVDILIVPYLLATGTHVAADIPNMVTEFKKLYPDITIRILPHIGTSKEMPFLIQRHVEGVGVGD